jgi:hypothetical protein
VEKEYSDS